jgi:hypothetical protein
VCVRLGASDGGSRHRTRRYIRAVSTRELLQRTNRAMIAFDAVLGSSALIAPSATLRVLGHQRPSEDALHLFRRCGPIWLTFAAAHAVAALRNRPEDWWALAWLRATEIATDIVWSSSPAVSRPGAKLALRLAGAFNAGATAGFAALARGT